MTTRKRAAENAAILPTGVTPSETLGNQSQRSKRPKPADRSNGPIRDAETGANMADKNNNKDSHVELSNEETFDTQAIKHHINCAALENSVPLYHGTSSGCPSDWISTYTRYGLLKGWATAIMVMAMPLFLRSSALSWFEALSTEVKRDYNSVCELFTAHFSMSKTERLAELDMLGNRRQVPGEPTENYLLDIHNRCMRLKRPADLEFEHAMQGLLPHIKQQVLLQQAATLDDIRRIGQLCELCIAPTRPEPAANKQYGDSDIMNLVATLQSKLEKQEQTIKELSDKKTSGGSRYRGQDEKCKWCGRNTCKGKTVETREANCFAYGKTCYVCDRLHHISKVCFRRAHGSQKTKGGHGKPQNSAGNTSTRPEGSASTADSATQHRD